MDISSFIPDSLIVLVVATNMLGIFLKEIEVVKDNYIPVILLMFSTVFSIAIMGLSPESVLQGVITWGVAVGIHQTIHQLTIKK